MDSNEATADKSAVDRAIDDDLASPASGHGGSASEERAQSFRRRRLTFTRHHILSDSAAAAVAELLAKDDESIDEDLRLDAAVDDGVMQGLEADGGSGDKGIASSTDDGVGEPTKKKARTESTPLKKARSDSMSSSGSGTSSYLPSRVLHAGEIVRRHSDSSASGSEKQHGPIVERRTGLHSHPSHPNHDGSGASKWRQRFSFCSTAPDHVLPFPRHVVGTYSHHGIEPVYDSDYDDDESSDDEDANLGGGTIAKINQDRGGIAYPFANSERTALFAVYDGHGGGGELVSQYALCEVQRRLESSVQLLGGGTGAGGVERDIAEAMRETFLQVDRGLLDEEEIEPMYAGTTANVVLVRDGVLYVANCGDSRAVLARSTNAGGADAESQDASSAPSRYDNMVAVPLSIDQNPDSPGEKERILSSGGFVSPPPEPGLSSRVWLDAGQTQVGLAMARSIGDHAVKGVGVIAEPVVETRRIVPGDEFVIMATDGVWEFIDSDAAVEIVAGRLRKGEGASVACEALIDAATRRWREVEGCYRDDITAIVIRLGDLWSWSGGDGKGN